MLHICNMFCTNNIFYGAENIISTKHTLTIKQVQNEFQFLIYFYIKCQGLP